MPTGYSPVIFFNHINKKEKEKRNLVCSRRIMSECYRHFEAKPKNLNAKGKCSAVAKTPSE